MIHDYLLEVRASSARASGISNGCAIPMRALVRDSQHTRLEACALSRVSVEIALCAERRRCHRGRCRMTANGSSRRVWSAARRRRWRERDTAVRAFDRRRRQRV